MSTDSIPFSAIPHTSRLFLDYLFNFAKVSEFYAHRPDTTSVLEQARQVAREFPADRRAVVAGALARQNKAFGASQKTFDSIDRLRKGAAAVLSGQQVGLFGGPLYSVLKAAHAVALAHRLTEQGVDSVPVFWLATEDHDLAEINHTWLPAGKEVRQYSSNSAGQPDQPVGTIVLGAEIAKVADEFATQLGDIHTAALIRECYAEGETYGSAFGKLFASLFAEHGLILVDPLDRELHAVFGPLMAEALARASEIDTALLARGKRLRDAGYHEQVKVTATSTLVFSLEDGSRTVVQLAGENFKVGTRVVPKAEMLARVQAHPEQFSPNVLLRPVAQDVLFPTAAYLGGPAEVAYFAQGGVVYEKLLGRCTPVLPRVSMTLINARMERLLKRYHITVPELFHGTETLRETLAGRVLPPGLRQMFDANYANLEAMLHELTEELDGLDHTLVEAAERAGRKMHYQLTRLSAKAARAELRRNEQINIDCDLILTELFPHKGLQERVLPGVYFVAKHGPELVDRLVDAAATARPGHQLVRI